MISNLQSRKLRLLRDYWGSFGPELFTVGFYLSLKYLKMLGSKISPSDPHWCVVFTCMHCALASGRTQPLPESF